MGEMNYPKRLSGAAKKTVSVAALTVLTGLILSGCSGAPAAPPSPDTAAPSATATQSAVPVPKLDAAHEASLTTELKKIDPELDTPRAVQGARQQCRLILRDAPEGAQLAFAKRLLRADNAESGPTADEKAKKIIAAIKSNGFCKPAA